MEPDKTKGKVALKASAREWKPKAGAAPRPAGAVSPQRGAAAASSPARAPSAGSGAVPFSVENIDFSTMDSSEAQLAMMAMQGMMANYMMGGGDLDLSFDDAFTDGAGGRSSGNRRGRGRGGGRTASRGRDSGGQLSKRVPRVLVLGVPAANWERALGVIRGAASDAIGETWYSEADSFGTVALASPKAIAPVLALDGKRVGSMHMRVLKCDIPPTVPSLVIKRLPASADEAALNALFEDRSPAPLGTSLLRDAATGNSKCTAFANYNTLREAIDAFSDLHDTTVDGQTLRIEFQRGVDEAGAAGTAPRRGNSAGNPRRQEGGTRGKERGSWPGRGKGSGRERAASSASNSGGNGNGNGGSASASASASKYSVPVQLYDDFQRRIYDQVVSYRDQCDRVKSVMPELVFSEPLPRSGERLLQELCSKLGLQMRPLGGGEGTFAVALAPPGSAPVPVPTRGRRSRANSTDVPTSGSPAGGTRPRSGSLSGNSPGRSAVGWPPRPAGSPGSSPPSGGLVARVSPAGHTSRGSNGGGGGGLVGLGSSPPIVFQGRPVPSRSRSSSYSSVGGPNTAFAKGPDGTSGFARQRSAARPAV